MNIKHTNHQLNPDNLLNLTKNNPIEFAVPFLSSRLTAITSYLDPLSLSALAVVDIYLNGHVKDDNTWRRAFFYQFLGVGNENDLDDKKALLLRGVTNSRFAIN